MEYSNDNRFLDSLFKIREFEKDWKIYEKLWVKQAQAIVMWTIGKIFKIIGMNNYSCIYFIGKNIDEESLRFYEWWTRFNEWVHISLWASILFSLIAQSTEGFNIYVIFPALWLITNWYSHMIQRYNRARVMKILDKRYKKQN